MSGAATQTAIPEFKQIMGHPAPLWMLFMTEFWERLAFYGIHADFADLVLHRPTRAQRHRCVSCG